MSARRRGRAQYQRTDRVAELIREIVAGEIERIDDIRLVPLAVTGVDVDNELVRAVVYYDVLDSDDVGELDEVEGALAEHRHRIQQALAQQSRMRRTPALEFAIDPSIGAATRIEQILDDLGMGDESRTDGDPERGEA